MCGFHSFYKGRTICRHVDNSSPVGVLVCASMVVPSTINGSTKSRSGDSIYNGELLYRFSCTVTPKCCNLLGLTNVCSIVVFIHNPSCSIMMRVSANSNDVHTVAAETMGTFLIASYSSLYGNTSHYLPVSDNNIKLCLNTIVSAWVSISILPCLIVLVSPILLEVGPLPLLGPR